jgi:multidrug efflux pump subunit AcrB
MGISGRIAARFLRSRLTPLLALVAALLGTFAVLVTPREEEPQINVTMANVLVPFPGATAGDVESLVASPAEQVLSRITGVEHIFSTARPELAVLTVQFKVGEDRTQALVRLYDTLNSNRDWVRPELGVGEFIVKPLGVDDVPVVAITLFTRDRQRGGYDLRQVGNAVEAELVRVAGARTVETIGGAQRQVRIELDTDRLASFHVTAADVRGALLAADAALPGGRLTRDNRDILVEGGAWLRGAQDIGRLVVGSNDGRPVYVDDVARVADGPELSQQYVWHGIAGQAAAADAGHDSEYPAVTLAVTKKPGSNAVDVARRVIERFDGLKGTVVPSAIDSAVTRNYGATANEKAMKLIQKLVFATLSVIALVWIALGRRESAIVGAAVMLTLAATLFASWAWGFTLNRVSLFALIFSIGILVDDAIVVVENIHRTAASGGRSLIDTIPGAVDEVGGPTILATLTVIAALLPMAFVSGLMGPYMSPIPINASMGMLISLAIAFVVTPWLALHLLPAHAPAPHAVPARLHALAERLLTPFLSGRSGARARRLLGAAVLVLIALSVSLAAVKLVVLKMLPFDNKSELQVIVDLPRGSSLEATSRALHEMGRYLATVEEVTDYQAYAGTHSPISFNGLVRQYFLRAEPQLGDLQVNLVDKHRRARKSHEVALAVRAPLTEIARRHRATVKIVEVPPGPPVLSPLVAEVYGPDYAGQQRVAKRIERRLAALPDVVDLDDSVDEPAGKTILRVDQNKAALRGIAPADVVRAVRIAMGGDPVTPLYVPGARREIPIVLTLPPERLASLDEALKVPLRTTDGRLISLSELVETVPVEREQTIYHKDLLPVVYVTADAAGKLDSPLYGMFEARGGLVGEALPEGGRLGEYFVSQPADRYAEYAFKWDGEWQVTYETFRDMGIAYAVGLVLIYVLVVAQFGSYSMPLVIMAPIPLTVIGVMPGHAVLGAQFTATSMIGMIALAGIIVRNSILLVDFIELRLAAGEDLERAIVEAVAVRAKPIALTGVAAMMGAFFILDDPIFNGLAISLLFGILVSTVLTLLVIPVLFYAGRWRAATAAHADDRSAPSGATIHPATH